MKAEPMARRKAAPKKSLLGRRFSPPPSGGRGISSSAALSVSLVT
jgi:hypothetical protein